MHKGVCRQATIKANHTCCGNLPGRLFPLLQQREFVFCVAMHVVGLLAGVRGR
jgi:hypothetical protein